MTDEELKSLDFILPKLSDAYPDRISSSSLNDEYKENTGIDIDYRDINILVESYDGEYFDKTTPMRHIRITPEWDEKIKIFESLSNYLNIINEKIEEENKKQVKIEALNKKVSELSIVNLGLQNKQLKLKIIYSVVGAVFTAILTNWKDILIMLQIIDKQ